jgi:hypothetical protein
MIKQLRNIAVSATASAMLITGVPARPAAADTTSTLILGAAALIGGMILYNNYNHKRQAANQVVGYTQNGGTIYGDGRIVTANGRTFYPDANGRYPGGGYAYYNQNAQPVAYDYQRSGQYDRTHRHDNRDFGRSHNENRGDRGGNQGNRDNHGDHGGGHGDHG